jgi:hypothetical protein
MMRRREALRGAALALAATVIAPAAARAASDDGGILLGLWRREMAAAFAYENVLHADPVLALLHSHELDHAAAIATELAALGLGTPQPPGTTAELDIVAERLATSGPDRTAVLEAAIALEQGLDELYRAALPALPEASIAMTAATILASHSQHLLILRRETGHDPLAAR